MRLTMTSKGFDLSDAQKRHIEKKLSKLDRFFGDEIEATVRARSERGREIVEVTIPLQGTFLRAQESTQDLYASLDLVMEKLTAQIRKHRTRLERRVREGAYLRMETEDAQTIAQSEQVSQLVRTKSFRVSPMSPEEAISQMEMLGHTFFVFHNEQTDSVCVVYGRDDGNFGLLIPERG